MLIVFLAALWEGCTEFSLDRERLDRALAVLDAEARDADEAEVLIAPLVGLQMSLPRLQLPHGVRVVRADAIEAPVEAMRSEGMGRAAWEPQFLAVAEQGEGAESAAAALRQLRELISVMRLFKGGGVGLGPYAFAPTGEGPLAPDRRPAPRPTRPGGYRLSEERGRASSPSSRPRSRPGPTPTAPSPGRSAASRWAASARAPLEGLSDHLLALRAVLDGHGPGRRLAADARRGADRATTPCDRIEARERIEDGARARARR